MIDLPRTVGATLGGHSLSTESVHCIQGVLEEAALRRRLEHGENFYDTQMKGYLITKSMNSENIS